MASSIKFVDADRFRELALGAATADTAVTRLSSIAVAPDNGSRTARFVLSDSSVDRMGDRIFADGWELARYRRNPTVLWAHDASAPPIGRMTQVFVSGNKLMGVKFAPASTYEFADTVYKLVVDGFVCAGSVGFLPLEWKFTDNPNRPSWGVDFKRVELLEFSICPIPANANALIEGKRLRSRRAADDPVRELGRTIGHLIRAARLRNALPPVAPAAPEPQWRRVERARQLRRWLDEH